MNAMKLALAAALVLAAGTPAGASTPTVADLAWIAGNWTMAKWGGELDEVWSAPRGDSMIGMFRYSKGGRTVLYEFLTIEQEAAGPVLKFRHFNRGLVGWEEKDRPLVCPLKRLSGREAVFEGTDPAKPLRLTFRRDGDGPLVVVLERTSDGTAEVEEFRYKS